MYHAPVHKLKFWGAGWFVYYGWEQLSIFIYNHPLGHARSLGGCTAAIHF